jgi:hypothetical protein
MPQPTGRRRVNLEQQILEDMSALEKQAQEIVAQKIDFNTPSIMAFEAACLLRAIELGTDPQKIYSTPIFKRINQYARKNGPHGKWPGFHGARDFLEDFIQTHAPSWDRQEDARQGEIEDRNSARENERFAKERAEDARWRMAHATKFYTPDAPDGVLLSLLAWEYRKRRRIIRRVWPTLRELKLATAIPERTLQKIIKSLRPARGEIIKEPLRHKFSRRGAVPLRYGPRLVIGVLNEFVNRLPEFSMDDEQRKRLRKTALLVRRAFAARLGHSRPIT